MSFPCKRHTKRAHRISLPESSLRDRTGVNVKWSKICLTTSSLTSPAIGICRGLWCTTRVAEDLYNSVGFSLVLDDDDGDESDILTWALEYLMLGARCQYASASERMDGWGWWLKGKSCVDLFGRDVILAECEMTLGRNFDSSSCVRVAINNMG